MIVVKMNAASKTATVLCVLALAWIAGSTGAIASDVENKFRVGISVGGINGLDEVESDSENQLNIRQPSTFDFERIFIDPRDDASAFSALDLQASQIANLWVQYGVTKRLVVEFSAGYTQQDLGDAELQVQFTGIEIDQEILDFNFQAFDIPLGEVERIPLHFSIMGRFRPRSNFNPYVGAGIGWSFIGFEPSDEFNELSRNIDASIGQQTLLTNSLGADPAIIQGVNPSRDLSAPTVDIRDTFEYSFFVGGELTFKKNWAVFAEVRQSFSSRDLTVSFDTDGDFDLGNAVPQLEDFAGSPADLATYGPVLIDIGGLVDGGSTDASGTFVPGEPDGQLDPGFYYVQGGRFAYDIIQVNIGVRYTF